MVVLNASRDFGVFFERMEDEHTPSSLGSVLRRTGRGQRGPEGDLRWSRDSLRFRAAGRIARAF